MPESFQTASAFTITERTGQRRTIRLLARALPYRPFSLKSSQRSETTWYPGNPEATQQVFGGQEEPTTINGFWKDRFLGDAVALGGGQTSAPFTLNGEPIDNVRDAERLTADVCKKGQEVEVTWDGIARRGILKEFERNWHNVHDLEWTMQFEWSSDAEPAGPAVFAVETSTNDIQSTLRRQTQQLTDDAAPTFPTVRELQDAVTSALQRISAAVDQVEDAQTNAVNGALTPFDTSRRFVALCTSLVTETEALQADLLAHVAGAAYDAPSLADLTYAQRLLAERFVRRLYDDAQAIRRTALVARDGLVQNLEGTLLATYTAREGEDLRDVSRQFYNTPFEWQRLLVFNGLASAALVGGQLVLVPRLQTGEA